MMRTCWLIPVATLCAVAAYGRESPLLKPTSACPEPVEHRPADNLEARPGEDADGWAVAHPETPGSQKAKNLNIGIGLDLPLESYTGTKQTQADIREARIHAGQATLGGEDPIVTLNVPQEETPAECTSQP